MAPLSCWSFNQTGGVNLTKVAEDLSIELIACVNRSSIKQEMTMARGGKREGAGRPRVDRDEQSAIILDDLLIPAFNACGLTGEVVVGVNELQAAYGRQGLADWRTWFEEVELGHGIQRGGVATRWRLKLKLAVAAKKLLSVSPQHVMLWPSELLKAVQNKRAYDAFWREHAKCGKELNAVYGTETVPPQPFDPSKNYLKLKPHTDRDQVARAPVTDGTKGWSELLVDSNHGFTSEITNPVFIEEEFLSFPTLSYKEFDPEFVNDIESVVHL